jgi:hypothetical protein
MSIIGALAVIAAINPTMQTYAQDTQENTVTATQSNSFTADISQSQTVGDDETYQGGAVSGFDNEVDGDGAVSGFDNEVDGDDGDVSQGFCLQANQQNSAAGDDASNTGTNEITLGDCS